MSGWAVRKDGTGFRAVDIPVADPNDDSKLFPDPAFENYSEVMPERPKESPEEVLDRVRGQANQLLSVAGLRIAPLQDAVDLGEATQIEVAQLKEWKRYRVALNRLPEQTGYPETIEWPVLPA
ncbi:MULTISPECIES: tail fiber assembly protein [Pseudomonas]|uniref:tail fiber assembly protein n=1 Tax=Pseudomonas TaxID=286 RepID=UPI0006CDBE22|nr:MULTISPECIES: tail fiber assembly protein [Pseudomonas]KPA99321.1 Caudovirales tail fiber assembly protein [Pseudomonas fuscovaginae]